MGLIAASTALSISNIPWKGPIGGVRVARSGGQLTINPNRSDLEKPEMEFETFAAGPTGKINMIELAGKEAKEEDILGAFVEAQREIARLVAFQQEIIKQIGQDKEEVALYEPPAAVREATEKFLADRIEAAVYVEDKVEQNRRLAALKTELAAHLETTLDKPDPKGAEFVMEKLIAKAVHRNILEKNRRPDGRAMEEVRKLQAEVGLFARTHGSAFFARGSTQALAIATLAPPGQEQLIETMEVTAKRRFLLHYNFPPYSVGETGMFRGPGRREIGHGALADKALRPLIPTSEEFPYTIRVVSEIVSSNGSSSMATVCASTLALLDAGVPLKKPVAGIAMGLMLDEDSGAYKVLTDLQGPEDFWGDMDFKVAGTRDGITAIQLDVKASGLTAEIIQDTLGRAKAARFEILDFIETILAAPRPKLSVYVPMIIRLKINPDKIGLVIGPGGKTINGMIKNYGLTSIDIEEDGNVFIAAADHAKAEEAAQAVRAMTREYTVGEVVNGKVIKLLEFGAIVDLGGGKDGMIHVSELSKEYVKNVGDVIKVGDFVSAKIIRADEDGRIGLSLKQMDPKGAEA